MAKKYPKPAYGSRDGYCPHGVYVGGCGADYMCGACEEGADIRDEYRAFHPMYTMLRDGYPIINLRFWQLGAAVEFVRMASGLQGNSGAVLSIQKSFTDRWGRSYATIIKSYS